VRNRLARLARVPSAGSARETHAKLRAARQEWQRKRTVKKLIVLAVVAVGLAALWRKVQADRAELDLWTEATTADE
jgi:hypothetical protein